MSEFEIKKLFLLYFTFEQKFSLDKLIFIPFHVCCVVCL
jgi:hypothetical protein